MDDDFDWENTQSWGVTLAWSECGHQAIILESDHDLYSHCHWCPLCDPHWEPGCAVEYLDVH